MTRQLLYLFLFVSLCLFAAPARSIILYDGTNASNFTTDGPWDPQDFNSYFEYRSLDYDKEAHALDYQMLPKKDKLSYLLKQWRQNGLVPTERIVLKARNLGKTPLNLYLQWAISREDVPGATKWFGWLFRDNCSLPADGQWHELSFNTKPNNINFSGAAKDAQPIYGPDGRFDIGISALPAGVETHLQIAEIRGEDDVVSIGKVRWTDSFPTEMTAGTEIQLPGFTVTFNGRLPFDQEARLVFRPRFKDESWPVLRIPLENVQKNGMTWSMTPCTLKLTPFLLDGKYDVSLECGEAYLQYASYAKSMPLFVVNVHGRKDVSFPNMTVKEFGGRPTMFKNGEPLPGVMRATYAKEGPKNIRAFSDCGVNIFGFCSTPTEGGYCLSMQCEYAPGKYNYQQFDNRMRATLDENPNAMLIIRLYLNAPRWWSQEHPDDVSWTGDPKDPNGATKPLVWHYGMKCPSWASRAWRDYTRKGLRRMMDFMAQTPYADHIAGFVLASGTTEEWMEWAFNRGAVPDYSPVSRLAFREWLANKYTTNGALQEAWKDSAVTLETAELPTAYERALPSHPGFMDPSQPLARKIADYNRYHSENVAECIAEFCKEVKESTQNKLLVGAFYGYEVELAGTSRELLSAHIGVGKLLKCPYLDYLCSPSGYEYRQVGGEGMSYAMGPADSLQLHNKFWFIENDIRTSATGDKNFGGAPDVHGDILQQTKESMHNLLSGMAQWWFDVNYIRFVDKELMDCIKQCVKVMDDTTLKYGRKPVAQVAMIIDEESIDWTTQPTKQVGEALRGFQRTQLAPMGAPYEVYLSDDLSNLPERIRIIFLPMSLAWKPEHKAALDKFLTNGRVVCFIGTLGVIPPAGMSRDESAQAFTGLPLRFIETPYTPVCLVDTPDCLWLSESATGKTYNNSPWENAPNSSVQAVLDEAEGVKVWGHYVDRKTGKATANGALGVKELPNASILFSGAGNLPRELLEAAYTMAGVHRYVDTPDQVWATENVLAVCVNEGGARLLRLPRKCDTLRDLFTGETFNVDAEGMVGVQFQKGQTRAFLMENNSTASQLKAETTTRLALIENSKPRYTILYDGESVNAKDAAVELQRQLKLITGADFSLKQSSEEIKGAYISVGKTPQASRIGIGNAPSDKATASIIHNDGNLFLYGNKDNFDAVMSFLENDVHCRFFTPEITHYPECDENFTVDVASRTETASFARRLILTDYGLVLNSDWHRHNRVKKWEHFDHPRDWFCHTYSKILPRTDFAKTPELFAVVDGKPSSTMLCPTHPENIRRAKELVRKAMEDNPNKSLFSIAESDGSYPYCHCQRCMDYIHSHGDAPIAAHLFLVNEVAKSVADKAPAQQVEFIVYSMDFHKPPVGIAMEPNVCMWYCANTNPDNRIAELAEWQKLVKKVAIWEYGVDFYNYFHILSRFPIIVNELKHFSAMDIDGVMCHETTGARSGDLLRLRAWVLAKLLWDSSLDTDTLAREYCDGVYGKAADDMFEYYNLVNAPGRVSKTIDEFYDMKDFLARADKCFQSALAKTPADSPELREIETDYLPVLVSRANALFNAFAEQKQDFNVDEYTAIVANIRRITTQYRISTFSETANMAGYIKERQMLVDMLKSNSNCIEVRAVDGRLYDYPQVKDPLAESGMATRQMCDGNWIVQWVLPTNLMQLNTPYQLEAEFRIEKASNAEDAVESGIYDNVDKDHILFAKVNGAALSTSEYRFVKLGKPFSISHRGEIYVYFSAPATSDVGSFYVNRIRLTMLPTKQDM